MTRLTSQQNQAQQSRARITVGIPAYANAKTIGVAIESVLSQTFPDFLLYISDDGSPDETADICAGYLKLDERVSFIRQPKNLRYQNFGWLLRQCQTEYFVWLAGDDRMAPDFLEKCIAVLEADADAVLVVPRVQFEVGGVPSHLAKGTFALSGERIRNICQFLNFPTDNSRMYGIFRTSIGRQCFPEESFHAWDWAFSLATLKYGRHLQLDEVLLHRDLTPSFSYIRMVDADARNMLERIFPLWGLLVWALRGGFLPARWPVLMAMLDIFLGKHVEYSLAQWPPYGRIVAHAHHALRRHLIWRFSSDKLPT